MKFGANDRSFSSLQSKLYNFVILFSLKKKLLSLEYKLCVLVIVLRV